MKRLAAIALAFAWVAIPVSAQRGASHGGFSGHSASSFRSGGAAAAFRGSFSSGRTAPMPRYTFNRAPAMGPSFARNQYASPGARMPYQRSSGQRMPYRSPRGRERPYGWGAGYGYPGWTGWINPYPWGYPYDWNDDDDSQPAQSYEAQADPGNTTQGYDDQSWGPPYADQPPPFPAGGIRQPYAPTTQSAAPEPAQSVTLVFNDGSPSEQIHNYILTPTSLYVLDQQRQTIPTDRIDLAATAKVNREAGVDFRLPGSAQ